MYFFSGLKANFFLVLNIILLFSVPQSIHSPTEGHLAQCQVLATMDKIPITFVFLCGHKCPVVLASFVGKSGIALFYKFPVFPCE